MPIPHRSQSGEGKSFLSGEQNAGFEVPSGIIGKVEKEAKKEYEYGEQKVNRDTYDFLKYLETQIGENGVLMVISRPHTKIENGDLINLDCAFSQITSLPELPDSLQQLWCFNIQITSLPELPASLQILNCSGTPLSRNPEEKDKLKKYCKEHNIFLSI